ncbi:acyl-CoA dehydrogenase [Quadrisphaera sp. DSM 44207]|uniref:acyl-CoA dehydrogenase family protein n=1 Tax=Quadrisphaera sp. DSM 44207 TaxID=1881057 RepID=UPI000B84EC35
MDGHRHEVRERIRASLPAELARPTDHLGTEEHRALTTQRLRALAALGDHLDGFSADVGGREDIGAQTVDFEMLGHVDLSLTIKSGVQWGLFAGAIQALGTERHRRAHLPGALDGSLLGCFAMTETGHGSDVASLRTTATYDAHTEEFVIHSPDPQARKDYIGGAARDARAAVVFAQLRSLGEAHGVHAFLVPVRDEAGDPLPGVTLLDCGRKAGLNGVDNGRILFDSVRVPREALLDRYGSVATDGTYSSPMASRNARFFTTLGALVKGRVCIGGGALAATRTALAIAVGYAERRRQFPRAGGAGEEVLLLDYRTHQRRLLPALATTVALGFAQDELTEQLHEVQNPVLRGASADSEAQRRLEARAAGMKATATWHASATIQAAREACGGAGYLSENRLGQLKADTDVFTTFEGDNTVLLQLVAKGLLTAYRDSFEDLDTLGTARAATAQLVATLASRTQARQLVGRITEVAPGRDETAELLDREWQLRTLQWRERRVLETLATRMRRAKKAGADAFTISNDVQDHLVLAARAHVAREVAEAFDRAVRACQDPQARALLSRTLDLHVLADLEADRAWLLERGWITPARSKALVRAVNDLCAQLRPHASRLVAGFGIPDEWLQAAVLQD